MAFDLTQFFSDLGFDADKSAELVKSFTPAHVSKLEAGYVAANDRAAIAAGRTELDTATAAVAAKEASLTRDIAEWATLTNGEKEQATALKARLEQADHAMLTLRQTVTRLAENAGIDPKTLLPEAAPVTTKTEVAAPIDTSKFVGADQFSTLMRYQMQLSADLPAIMADHQELTGKRLDTRGLVAQIEKNAKAGGDTDPTRVWEAMHGIPKIREDKANADIEARIARARSEGEEAGRSAISVPGVSHARSHRPSPVFTRRDANGKPATSVLQRPTSNSTVSRAAAALRSGKFAETTT